VDLNFGIFDSTKKIEKNTHTFLYKRTPNAKKKEPNNTRKNQQR